MERKKALKHEIRKVFAFNKGCAIRWDMDTDFFESHSHSVDNQGQKRTWQVKRLWELTRDFPRFQYRVSSFDKFDEDLWFCGVNKPTVGRVLEHMQRIETADLKYPIILSEDGRVMDGVHRILKARRLGQEWVSAVQFEINPKPDHVE